MSNTQKNVLGEKLEECSKDPLIYELMYNGRHYKILFMLTMQTPLGIKPDLRSNFDYFFLLATDI